MDGENKPLIVKKMNCFLIIHNNNNIMNANNMAMPITYNHSGK